MSKVIGNHQNRILKKDDFLSGIDVSPDSLGELLKLATTIKKKLSLREPYTPLNGKVLGMIFEKSSTRTRVSFEVGMLQLGGHAMFLSGNDIQIGRGETIADTAKVLSHYLDGIMIRTHAHSRIEELAENASTPIINGLTDLFHPCQALADLLTIKEQKGRLAGLKIAYIGDGNNVAHSLLLACAKSGMDISLATPIEHTPQEFIIKQAKADAWLTGGTVTLFEDPKEAVIDADIIYNDVWTSMGQEQENEIRLSRFKNYQVNQDLSALAKQDYIYMHCLPAHRGEEVTADIIDSSHSVVFEQAGNRLHAQKAVLVDLLG